MSQVTLINKSGIVINSGDFVKINRADPDLLSFLYAEYYDAEAMGVATTNCAPNKRCVINLFDGFSLYETIISELIDPILDENGEIIRSESNQILLSES